MTTGTKENQTAPDLVPLAAAMLCMDCEQISAANGSCPGCGSKALLSVRRVLDHSAESIRRDARNGRGISVCWRAGQMVKAGGE